MAQEWRTFKGTAGWWAWILQPWDRLNYNPQQHRLSAGSQLQRKGKQALTHVSWEVKFAYCSGSWLSGSWKFGTRRRVNQEEKHLDWSQSRHSLMHTWKGLHNFLPFLDWLKISPKSLWEAILSTGKPMYEVHAPGCFPQKPSSLWCDSHCHSWALIHSCSNVGFCLPVHPSVHLSFSLSVYLSVPLGYKTFYLDNC